MKSIPVGLSLTALVVVLSLTTQVFGIDVRTVALRAGPAPGGGEFFSLNWPTLNESGQVAFRAELCCPGTSPDNRFGVWSEGATGLSLVARSNRSAPGIPSLLLGGFGPPQLNNSGEVVFVANGYGAETVRGIWSNVGGSLTLVARSIDHLRDPSSPIMAQAPGTPLGVEFLEFESSSTVPSVAINDRDELAFRATLTGSGVNTSNNHGIWTRRNGSISLLARAGDDAPGTAPGAVFQQIDNPMLNNAGQVAFFATLAGNGTDGSNDRGIWSDDGSGLKLVARTGDPVGEAHPGLLFASLSSHLQNDSGQIAFRGAVAGPAVDSTNDHRIWLASGGEFVTVAEEGSRAPGRPDGTVFSGIFSEPILNDLGHVVFSAAVAGPDMANTNSGGIWYYDQAILEPVVLRGEQAPGVEDGVSFASVIRGALNNAGQFVFMSFLEGPEVTSKNDLSIWIKDRNQRPRLVLREGDLLNVSNDPLVEDMRTVDQSIRVVGLNDRGQLLLDVLFEDFSFGLFVFDVRPIPEPSSMMLLAVSVALLSGGGWRRRRW